MPNQRRVLIIEGEERVLVDHPKSCCRKIFLDSALKWGRSVNHRMDGGGDGGCAAFPTRRRYLFRHQRMLDD